MKQTENRSNRNARMMLHFLFASNNRSFINAYTYIYMHSRDKVVYTHTHTQSHSNMPDTCEQYHMREQRDFPQLDVRKVVVVVAVGLQWRRRCDLDDENRFGWRWCLCGECVVVWVDVQHVMTMWFICTYAHTLMSACILVIRDCTVSVHKRMHAHIWNEMQRTQLPTHTPMLHNQICASLCAHSHHIHTYIQTVHTDTHNATRVRKTWYTIQCSLTATFNNTHLTSLRLRLVGMNIPTNNNMLFSSMRTEKSTLSVC